ncbi:MAG TPA: YHS domain-containing protein [Nitrospiria bacterium]|nr:YHS domain-containing protein [Nitrospiria bacterium]
MAKDPVCGMQVDEQKAAGQASFEGKTYFFCSAFCKKKFEENPSQYAQEGKG